LTDTLPVYFVDAFADRPFAGNPAAICPLDAWLDDRAMQAIAAEIGFSETAFIVPERDGWRIRWFTPTIEVDLVGHATLAAAFVILRRIEPARAVIHFDSLGGPLTVTRQGDLLAMDFPARVAAPVAPPPGLVTGLGRPPVEVLAATHYLAVYEAAEDVATLAPDLAAFAQLDRSAVIVTAPSAPSFGGDFVSRFFAPANGVPEDPVSGVAHCALVPYWAERLGRTALIGRQLSRRDGVVRGRQEGERVALSGGAVLVLEGRIRAP